MFVATVGRNVLRSRCSAAIDALRRARVGLRPREPANSVRSLFRAKRGGGPTLKPPSKRVRVVSWTHKFMCLEKRAQGVIPTTDREKDALFEAGLGEKSLTIADIDCDYAAFRGLLIEAFPKLEDSGGFLFAKCRPNSRTLEPLSSTCLTSPRLLKERVGNAKTYIVPLQKDLDMTSVQELPSGVCIQSSKIQY